MAREIVFLHITFLITVSAYLIELAAVGNTNVIICVLSINACLVSIYWFLVVLKPTNFSSITYLIDALNAVWCGFLSSPTSYYLQPQVIS